MKTVSKLIVSVLLSGLVAGSAWAQSTTVLQDNFTGTSANLDWTALGGACLTAGDNTGSIPACNGLAYYGSQTQTGLSGNADPAGAGALRLTNGCANGTCYLHEAGAIITNTTYPTDQGVQVTFTTYTYGGDNNGGHGADGIGFYLINGAQAANLGSWGGSLGYSCSNSNSPYTGMVGAYLGLGMDEYGNFLNASDNTATGYGYQPGRIGLRGYGNIAWSWLNGNYSSDYPSTLSSSQQQAAVRNTCKTGYLWDFSNAHSPNETSTAVADYAPIPNAYVVLPSSTPLANEQATTRSAATPVSYKLKITSDGLLSLWYSWNGGSYVPVLTNQSITSDNGALPSSFKFGFGGSTGGADNVHEITCFQAAPATQSASSAGSNVQQSGEVRTGTQAYFAYYHSNNWWGEVTSQDLLVDPTTGALTISTTANWDASCVLTGGDCAATGATGMTPQTVRNLYSWNGTAGIALTWNNLTATEQGWLNDDSNGQARLAYLEGDRTNEVGGSGSNLFRARNSVLGDIIDSSPVWVGAPGKTYSDTWSDHIIAAPSLPENAAGAQTYSQFKSAEATRLNVVYDGANDGFLHGFETGAYDASGNYVSTSNDGKEVIAYMPQAVLQTIHNAANNGVLDYSSLHYAHNYYVDATPGIGDLFYNNAWHTWLVGGLGDGGNALFALDITTPSTFATSDPVVGEWSNSTLSCTNVANCGQDLGKTYGTPEVVRLHDGKWAIIFGNGLDSATGHAGIYVMIVDPSSGTPSTTYFLDTGVGNATTPDGIAYVSPADLDGDHIVDYVYAGDVYGNIWRFDLTSNNESNWKVSTYGNGTPTPLFADSSTFTSPGAQPITTKVQILSAPASSGGQMLMVDFGTGQTFPQTASSPAQYANGQQSLYGVIDWDMSGWDSLGSNKYKSMTGASSPVTPANLQTQTVTATKAATAGGVSGYRTVSNNAIGNAYGWSLALPGYIGVGGVGAGNQTEQVVYNPTVKYGAFVVNTTVPANNSPFTCSVNTVQSWTMAIDPVTGGALKTSFFAGLGIGDIASAIAADMVGTPVFVTAPNGSVWMYGSTSSMGGNGSPTTAAPPVFHINPPPNGVGTQLTWVEER